MKLERVATKPEYGPAPTPLRVYRVASGMTQAGLATRAGITRVTVSALERGANVPRLGTAQRLADALDVEVSALFPPEGS